MVIQAGGSVERFDAKRRIRAGLEVQGVGSVQLFRPYRATYVGMSAQGSGSVVMFAPKRRIRAGLVVAVNTLSQDDVTGAVLEARVEGELSLKESIRLLLSIALGTTDIDTTGPNPVVRFRDMSGTKDRVVAVMNGSERVNITKDVS
jgi:hypothetical protein